MNKVKEINWITGIKGCASIIVMLGHSVAVLFPVVFFGEVNGFCPHSKLELIIHNTPLLLFFSSSSMVSLFFCISGFLTSYAGVKRSYWIDVFNRYMRFLPMSILGIFSCYFVMKTKNVWSLVVKTFSSAGYYVDNYNTFNPQILGSNGALLESFLNVFIKGTYYNNTLWYINMLFLGMLLIGLVARIKNKNIKVIIYVIIVLFSKIFAPFIWQLDSFSFLAVGAIIGLYEFKAVNKYISKMSFVSGLFLLVTPWMPAGFFEYINRLGIIANNVRGLVSVVLILYGILTDDFLQRFFSAKPLVFLGKISFAIYVLHWSIVISIMSYIAFYFHTSLGWSYTSAGILGISIGVAIVVLLSFLIHKFFYDKYVRWVKKIVKSFEKA